MCSKSGRIESTDENGEPDGKLAILVAADNTFFADRYREPYQVFRINAIFVEGELSYEVKVNSNDLTLKGNYAKADLPETMPGDTVTVSIHLEPGCKVYGIYDPVTGTERLYDVHYASKTAGRTQVPITMLDANHFTFTVPNDIDPGDRAVYVSVVFAEIEDPVTVSFLPGNSTGAMDDVILERDSAYTLPDCDFDIPANSVFDHWSVQIGDAAPAEKAPGDEITVTADTTVTAVWITNWALLQRCIDSAENDAVIQLDKDVVATAQDAALSIPQEKTLTLDLAGFAINRNMAQTQEDGSVLKVFGALTLTDSSRNKTGTITGGSTTIGGGIRVETGGALLLEGGTVFGNTARNGGGILNGDTLAINSGTISGNTAQDSGGGIFNNTGGVLLLNGGKITGNTASLYGGGIHNQSTLRVSGNPRVTGNQLGSAENNLALHNSTVIQITGALSETACIGVNRSNGSQTGVISEGLSVGGTAANFQSDNASFKVAINDNAEAYLKNVYTVSVWSWSDDHSSASVTLVRAADGSEHPVDAVITTEEISAADCENDRVVKYTATAEYDGETYTDATDAVTLENTKLGHNWSAEWTWNADFTEAYVTLECETCHDKHSDIEAEISIDEETGVYTATAEFDGETFTDARTVVTLTFDMGGKCENYEVKAAPGEKMLAYYMGAASAAQAEGYWFEGITPLPPESYETKEVFNAANSALFYGVVPGTDTIYHVNWRTLETPSISIGLLKCGALLDETLPALTLAEPEHAKITSQRWVDGVSGTAVGGQDYQMYVCLNAVLHRGFTTNVPSVSGAQIEEYNTSAIQDAIILSVTAQHYADETSRKTETVLTPATATTAGEKEICVYCAGGCGEIIERHTEKIPPTGETDPTNPTAPINPDQPSGDSLCKWCNKDHSGNFWQRIVGFFHAIFYFWAHLFGIKKEKKAEIFISTISGWMRHLECFIWCAFGS